MRPLKSLRNKHRRPIPRDSPAAAGVGGHPHNPHADLHWLIQTRQSFAECNRGLTMISVFDIFHFRTIV